MGDNNRKRISAEEAAHLMRDLKEMHASGQITLAPGNTITDPAYHPNLKADVEVDPPKDEQ